MAALPEELIGQAITVNYNEQVDDYYMGRLLVNFSTEYDLTKGVDITFDGQFYKNVPVEFAQEDDSKAFLLGEVDLDLNPVLNKYPFFIALACSDNAGTNVIIIISYAKTEGEHTFTITEGEHTFTITKGGSGRVMKLSGASRTFSHTAEPRNVKFASSIKDWPIKKETTVIFDDSVTIETNSDTILIEDYSGTKEDFEQLKVEVNGEVLPFDKYEDGYFVENDFIIYMNITDIDMYSANGGTYQVKISGGEQSVVAEDFKEAVVLSGLATIIEGKLQNEDSKIIKFITVNEMMALLQSGKIVYLKYPYSEGMNMGLVTGMHYDAVNQITKISGIVEGNETDLTIRKDGMIIISLK